MPFCNQRHTNVTNISAKKCKTWSPARAILEVSENFLIPPTQSLCVESRIYILTMSDQAFAEIVAFLARYIHDPEIEVFQCCKQQFRLLGRDKTWHSYGQHNRLAHCAWNAGDRDCSKITGTFCVCSIGKHIQKSM